MTDTPPEIHRGLDGVIADTTAVSRIDPTTNSLLYRGYPVEQLAKACSFEEVVYLIRHGELPTQAELTALCTDERSQRELGSELEQTIRRLPPACHPMDVLRTAVSVIGARDPAEQELSAEHDLDAALSLLAKLPAVVALDHRRRQALAPVAPDPTLGFARNFLNLYLGAVPSEAVVHAFEVSLILYAEHGFNASTFTARVVTSTRADLYSAITAAIGALKGPLHGGANEAVMRTLLEIGTAQNAAGWLDHALGEKRKIMGFGHRVYKHGDSRVPAMEAELKRLVTGSPQDVALLALYHALATLMLERKALRPNLDYPSGLAYHLMGIDTETFTPLFVISRLAGWAAHVREQREADRLIRPLGHYTGPALRPLPPR